MLAVQVKNLHYSYDNSVETIKNISLDIPRGKFVSVVGHNGCGKSTLAKLLMGLIHSSNEDAEIIIDGVALSKKTLPQIRQHMALVFQNPDNQFIGATVEDDIAFGLENRCVNRNDMQGIINEVSEQVGMREYLKNEPSMLSGGQKQRVAIAGALALTPNLIIFDESTSMLDPRGKKDIRDLIIKMRKNNPDLTVISITHDIEEAFESDEVVVMSKGEIVAHGSPKEVLNNKELMKEAGLDRPFVLSLKDKLAERGIDIPSVDSLDELVEVLWQSK